MRSRRMRWLTRILARLLIWGLLLAGSGPGVASAASPTTEEILAKVDQVLTTIGGIQDGNHTLRWDQNLLAAQRFVILPAFNNEAVLGKNTGLVWEQAPDATARPWAAATSYCVNKNVGGTRGWRVPSVAELTSLIDPSLPAPFVPATAFTGLQSSLYWSATSSADIPNRAWPVFFSVGDVNPSLKASSHYVWCVRGGMNADQY